MRKGAYTPFQNQKKTTVWVAIDVLHTCIRVQRSHIVYSYPYCVRAVFEIVSWQHYPDKYVF